MIVLEGHLREMVADLQSCARIVGTPMPFAYLVHLRSFVVLWLAALPFAFLPTIGPWSVLICAVVAYQLLGFEDIGEQQLAPSTLTFLYF
jgi:putative membrane protein